MDLEILNISALIILSISSLLILLINDWRICIILLSIQYIGVFILVLIDWPLQMAITKLVAGWMAGAVLGVAVSRSIQIQPSMESRFRSDYSHIENGVNKKFIQRGGLFYLFGAGFIAISVYYIAPELYRLMPDIDPIKAFGGLILIGMGLIILGFSIDVFKVMIGLLILLAGFEIIYSSLENSILVAGLLALITLGIALAGAYMLLTPEMDEIE